jgi:hypothetical protein
VTEARPDARPSRRFRRETALRSLDVLIERAAGARMEPHWADEVDEIIVFGSIVGNASYVGDLDLGLVIKSRRSASGSVCERMDECAKWFERLGEPVPTCARRWLWVPHRFERHLWCRLPAVRLHRPEEAYAMGGILVWSACGGYETTRLQQLRDGVLTPTIPIVPKAQRSQATLPRRDASLTTNKM